MKSKGKVPLKVGLGYQLKPTGERIRPGLPDHPGHRLFRNL